jgi:hypothetical protein
MKNMKTTVVIWDNCDAALKFFVVNGDLRKLNNKYVNSTECSNKDADKICGIVYDSEGKSKVEMFDTFPVDEVLAGAFVVIMGFLP